MGTLGNSVRYLAGVCDGATAQDGAGFNRFDASFGHKLANIEEEAWSDGQRYAVWEMVRKYTGQLAAAGIDFGSIPEPVNPKTVMGARKVAPDTTHKWVVISFPYSAELVRALKETLNDPNRIASFHPPSKTWYILYRNLDKKSLELLSTFCAENQFEGMEEVRAAVAGAISTPVRKSNKLICSEDSCFRMGFSYDASLVDAIRAVKAVHPGIRFQKDKGNTWSFPKNGLLAPALMGLITDFEIEASEEVLAEIEGLTTKATETIKASHAESANIEPIEGFGSGDLTPYPFQLAGIHYAAAAMKTFIADEMGLGKTPQSLGVLQKLNAFPALVVCPASLRLNWKKEVEMWLPGRTVSVIDSKSEDYTADIMVISYAGLSKGKKTDKKILPSGNVKKTSVIILSEQATKIRNKGLRALVLDESQSCKTHDTQRTMACKEIARGVQVRLALTGTPIVNRPKELVPQLDILGRLEEFGGFWQFVIRYCDAKKKNVPMRGRGFVPVWDMNGNSNLSELNERLRAACYIRRTKEQVLPELPPKRRVVVNLPITNRAEYDRAENDFASWLGENKDRDAEFEATLSHLSDRERGRIMAERSVSEEQEGIRALELQKISALRKLAVQGKMAAVKEWTDNFIESGEKLVAFAHLRDIQKEMWGWYKGTSHIIGGESPTKVEAAKEKFQTEPAAKCPMIVVSIQAGKMGHTLTAASNSIFVEIPWTPGDLSQCEDRTNRIGQVYPTVAWYLFADDTIDEDMAAFIESKRDVVDAATEGSGEIGMQAQTMKEVIGRLTERRLNKMGGKR